MIIKIKLHNIPPLILTNLHFILITFPTIFFITQPKIPLNLLLKYKLTINFTQFTFLFYTINFNIPTKLTSLILQTQTFFTIILNTFTFKKQLHNKQLTKITLTIFNILILIKNNLNNQHITILNFMLTLTTTFN